MGRSVLYLVSDDFTVTQKARTWAEETGVTISVYSTAQWNTQVSDPSFAAQLRLGEGGGKVLPFPGNHQEMMNSQRVASMDEIESQAIKNAIFEYKGNLTEAAKALGIGRATLYRKVKQYNIDPSQARNRSAKAA